MISIPLRWYSDVIRSNEAHSLKIEYYYCFVFLEKLEEKEQKPLRFQISKEFQVNHDLLKRSDHALQKISSLWNFSIQFVIEISTE